MSLPIAPFIINFFSLQWMSPFINLSSKQGDQQRANLKDIKLRLCLSSRAETTTIEAYTLTTSLDIAFFIIIIIIYVPCPSRTRAIMALRNFQLPCRSKQYNSFNKRNWKPILINYINRQRSSSLRGLNRIFIKLDVKFILKKKKRCNQILSEGTWQLYDNYQSGSKQYIL